MKNLLKKVSPIALMAFPYMALAQSGNDLSGFIGQLLDLINAVIPLLIAVATLVFIFGVIKYITAGGEAEELKKARGLIIYGIIGLAVIVGVWGLVNLVLSQFGLENARIPTGPQF